AGELPVSCVDFHPRIRQTWSTRHSLPLPCPPEECARSGDRVAGTDAQNAQAASVAYAPMGADGSRPAGPTEAQTNTSGTWGDSFGGCLRWHAPLPAAQRTMSRPG